MALNFDGGPLFDRVMLTVSGTAMWLPLYALILWLVWRRSGWRGMLVFLVLMLLALGLSDLVSGIFKHNGLLGDMLPQFEPRPAPDVHPLARRARDHARLAARPAPCGNAARLGGTRPARGRKRHVRHRLGARGHDRRAGRTLVRCDPPQVVHRPDGRLHPSSSAIRASTWASISRWISYGARSWAPYWATPPCGATAGWHRAGTDDSPTPAEAYLRRIY